MWLSAPMQRQMMAVVLGECDIKRDRIEANNKLRHNRYTRGQLSEKLFKKRGEVDFSKY